MSNKQQLNLVLGQRIFSNEGHFGIIKYIGPLTSASGLFSIVLNEESNIRYWNKEFLLYMNIIFIFSYFKESGLVSNGMILMSADLTEYMEEKDTSK